MDLNTRYITLDEFRDWSGIDLAAQLKKDDNPSNTAQAFLERVTYRLETFIDATFYKNIANEYPTFTDYQKEHYKHALLEQVLYVFKMGDISVDSGYDPDKGEVASNSTLAQKTIAPNAKQELLLCGVWCRKIKSRAPGLWGNDYLW